MPSAGTNNAIALSLQKHIVGPSPLGGVGIAYTEADKSPTDNRSSEESDVLFGIVADRLAQSIREQIDHTNEGVEREPITVVDIPILSRLRFRHEESGNRRSVPSPKTSRTTYDEDDRPIVVKVIDAKLSSDFTIVDDGGRHYIREDTIKIVIAVTARGHERIYRHSDIVAVEELDQTELLTHPSPEVRKLAKKKYNHDAAMLFKQLITEGEYTSVDHHFISDLVKTFDCDNHPKLKELIAIARKLADDDLVRIVDTFVDLIKIA